MRINEVIYGKLKTPLKENGNLNILVTRILNSASGAVYLLKNLVRLLRYPKFEHVITSVHFRSFYMYL